MQPLTTQQLLAQIPKEIEAIQRKQRLDQEREAWLASRRGRLTASAISKLFTKALKPADNKTARQYIYEKVAEKLGAQIPHRGTAATQWGHDQEPYAVIEYMKRTGNQVTRWGDGEAYEVDGKSYQSDGQRFIQVGEYLGATPDGLILPRKTLQVKCPYNPGIHLSYLMIDSIETFKKVLPEYYIQVQVEMKVGNSLEAADVEACDFVSYDPRVKSDKSKMKIIEIPIDTVFQNILSETLEFATQEIEFAVEKLAA